MRLTSDENVRLTLNENVGNHRGTKTTFGEVGTLASDCQLIILRGRRDGGGRGTSMPWARFRRGTNRHVIWIYLLREHGRRSIDPALADSPCPLCSLCSTCPLCFLGRLLYRFLVFPHALLDGGEQGVQMARIKVPSMACQT